MILRNRYRRLTCIVVIFTLVLFSALVIYIVNISNVSTSALYIIAEPKNSRHQIYVNIFINNAKQYSHIMGDKIPIIDLAPGQYELRVEARGYVPYKKIIDAPSIGEEIYIDAVLNPIAQ